MRQREQITLPIDVSLQVATKRMRSFDENLTRTILAFLEETQRVAPYVRQDLLENGNSGADAAAVGHAVARWAEKWKLMKDGRPCEWAVKVATDTLRAVPQFGWNLRSLLEGGSAESDESAGEAQNADRDFAFKITVESAEFFWKPSVTNPDRFIERVLTAIKQDIEAQMERCCEDYLEDRKECRHWQTRRPHVWLIRYLFGNETFTAISYDSEKHLAKRQNKECSIAAIIRDVEELADALGIDLPKRKRGRPVGSRDRNPSFHRKSKSTAAKRTPLASI